MLLILRLIEKKKAKQNLEKVQAVYRQMKDITEDLGSQFSNDYLFALSVYGYLFLISKLTQQVVIGFRVSPEKLAIYVNTLNSGDDIKLISYIRNKYFSAEVKNEYLYVDKDTGTIVFGDEAKLRHNSAPAIKPQLLN